MIRIFCFILFTGFVLILSTKSSNKDIEIVRETFSRIRQAYSSQQSKNLEKSQELLDGSRNILRGFEDNDGSLESLSQQHSSIMSEYLRFVESNQMDSQWQIEQLLIDMERSVEASIELSRHEIEVQHALWQIHNIRREQDQGFAEKLLQFRQDFVNVFETGLKRVWREIELFQSSIPMLREYWRYQIWKEENSIEKDLQTIELIRQMRAYLTIDGMEKAYKDSIGAVLDVEKSRRK